LNSGQHLDAEPARVPRHLQIEFGVVDQYQQVGTSLLEPLFDDRHCSFDITPVTQYLDQADHRDGRRIEKHVDAGALHFPAAHAAEPDVRPQPPELFDEFGGVGVAGGFPGENHDMRGFHQALSRASHTVAICCSVISGNIGNERQRCAVASVTGSSGCTVSAKAFCWCSGIG
jgi:hypothetical protein